MSSLYNAMQKTHPAKILIAMSIENHAYVIATDSEWVAQEVQDICDNCDDVGILSRKDYENGPGVYLWEGTLRSVQTGTPMDGYEYETEYTGTLKPIQIMPSDLLSMEPPFDYPAELAE